jgi:hypothetical protein
MIRSAICVTLGLALTAGSAVAQPEPDDEPRPRPSLAAPRVPDSALSALRNRTIAVQRRNGASVVGELLGYDSTSLTLALTATRDVVTLGRSEIVGLRIVDNAAVSGAAGSGTAQAANAGPVLIATAPARERYFGLELGLAPAVMLDLEKGYFYGFLNADIVLPMASAGGLLAFAAGGGVSFALTAHSRWRMDVFAHFTPVSFSTSDWYVSAGVGLGFHYTAANGFTLGFKTPILGYAARLSGDTNAATGVALYYLAGVMGLPVISLGYRF